MVKVVRRGYIWLVSGAVLLAVLGGLLVVRLMQSPSVEAQQLRLRAERAALLLERSELEAERTQTASRFNQAQRALLIERAKRLELEKILANVQSELGRKQDQLAFFEDLLPPSPQGALDIRAVDVRQHAEGLHYRVLLMRSGKTPKHFVGALQFIATGLCRENGEASQQTIILQPLLAKGAELGQTVLGARLGQAEAQRTEPQLPAQRQAERQQAESQLPTQQQTEPQQTEAQQAVLRLDFAQFQRGQGLLAIPPGFSPTSVTVRVLEGDIVLASNVVAL